MLLLVKAPISPISNFAFIPKKESLWTLDPKYTCYINLILLKLLEDDISIYKFLHQINKISHLKYSKEK